MNERRGSRRVKAVRGKSIANDRLSAIGLGFVFCVLLPAFVTGIAPATWIHLQRREDQVTATAKTCLFFVIPYKTAVVEPLIGVGERFVAGELVPRADRRDQTYRSEDEAFLRLRHPEKDVEIPVSPASIEKVSDRISEFLTESQDAELRLFVVANWKFSVIAGGLLSFLTLLYCLGLLLSAAGWLLRLLKGPVVPWRHQRVSR